MKYTLLFAAAFALTAASASSEQVVRRDTSTSDLSGRFVGTADQRNVQDRTPDQVLARHSKRISSLGLPQKFLKATIYLQTDLVNRPTQFIPFELWIALVFESGRYSTITAVEAGRFQGVRLKSSGVQSSGVQSSGFLFRLDEGELFPTHVVIGDGARRIQTTQEAYVVSLEIMRIAAEGLPDSQRR